MISPSKRPIIAVDAMGGDNAPAEIVAGALLAARAYDADIVLVGDESQIQALLGSDVPANIRIVHAPDAVPMDQHASQALRQSGTTSLGVAVSMVKSGDADAVVSAGNSGAFLAIALIKLRTIEGIARPAIATVWPALKGPTVLLDSGANVDCRAEWLEQCRGYVADFWAESDPLRNSDDVPIRPSTSPATSKARTCSATRPT